MSQLKMSKTPQQNRSRETVRAILEATAYILESFDIEGLTTNRIAEKSGVNIASIYQYFKNKEAILSELIRDIVEYDRRWVRSCFERAETLPKHEQLNQVTEEILTLFSYKPNLRRVLVPMTPYLGDSRYLAKVKNEYLELFGSIVCKPRSAEVMLNALIGVCNAYSETDPHFYKNPKTRREIVILCAAYVQAS